MNPPIDVKHEEVDVEPESEIEVFKRIKESKLQLMKPPGDKQTAFLRI